jgi:hypothetical protein
MLKQGKKMKSKIVVGTNALLKAAKQMQARGELSPEQYSEMCRRNKSICPEFRRNNIIMGD